MNNNECLRREDQVELNFEFSKENIRRNDLKKIIELVIEENKGERTFRKAFTSRVIREYQSLFSTEKDMKKCLSYFIIMTEEIVDIIEKEIKPDDEYYCKELKEYLNILKIEEKKSRTKSESSKEEEKGEEIFDPKLQKIKNELEESTRNYSDEELDEILKRK